MSLALFSVSLLITASPVAPSDMPTVGGAQVTERAGSFSLQGSDSDLPQPQQEPASGPDAAVPDESAQSDTGAVSQAEDGNVIVVTNISVPTPGDPLGDVNESSFEVTQKVDAAVVGPMAEVYEEDVPKPLRNGLRNFLRNLLEPVVFLNYILQLKPDRAAETLGRFAINTTAGIGGLFDVAEEEPFNLPYRPNGFANTLGYYGVGPGPFLLLPLVGATTLRDVIGGGIDQAIIPYALGAPFNTPYYSLPAFAITSLQVRMEFDDRLDQITDSVDPYVAMRESYLCLREAEIAALHDNLPPRDCAIDALMSDEAFAAQQAAARASRGEPPVADAQPALAPVIQPGS